LAVSKEISAPWQFRFVSFDYELKTQSFTVRDQSSIAQLAPIGTPGLEAGNGWDRS